MNIIENYLSNVFATLPKTNEMETLKQEMQANMEDKYHELKQEGKSENEAIGIVISEFGNVDELIKEFNLSLNETNETMVKEVSEEEVKAFFQVSKRTYKLIGGGVFLCIFGSALLVFLLQLFEQGHLSGLTENGSTTIAVTQLLFFVTIAVSMFIYGGMKMEKYKYLERTEEFHIPYYMKKTLEKEKEAYHSSFYLSIIISVALCILSPIVLLVTNALDESATGYSVSILLLIVATAVYLFIVNAGKMDAYKKLLKIDEYSKERTKEKKENKVIGAFAAIIWPLAVAIFLISGFVYGNWHINWIIFPIAGLIMGMFGAVYSILKKDQ